MLEKVEDPFETLERLLGGLRFVVSTIFNYVIVDNMR